MRAKCSCVCVYSVDTDGGHRCYRLEVFKRGNMQPSFSLVNYSKSIGPIPYAYKTFNEMYTYILRCLKSNHLDCIVPLNSGWYDILFVDLSTGKIAKYHYDLEE